MSALFVFTNYTLIGPFYSINIPYQSHRSCVHNNSKIIVAIKIIMGVVDGV